MFGGFSCSFSRQTQLPEKLKKEQIENNELKEL